MSNNDYLIVEGLIGQALDQPENFDSDGSLIDDYVAADIYIDAGGVFDHDDLDHALTLVGVYQSTIGKVYPD